MGLRQVFPVQTNKIFNGLSPLCPSGQGRPLYSLVAQKIEGDLCLEGPGLRQALGAGDPGFPVIGGHGEKRLAVSPSGMRMTPRTGVRSTKRKPGYSVSRTGFS